MSLVQFLTEFRFNLDTTDLLVSLGRNQVQVNDELSKLGFNTNLVQLMTTQRLLLNSVLLRLQLYSEQNTSEQKIRSGLSVLNNKNVTSLLDLAFCSTVTVVPASVQQVLEPEVDKEDESNLDRFYSECLKQTNDATDILKTSDVYDALSKWWPSHDFTEDVPDKNELKDFLTEKLGKPTKNTWSGVSLN